MTDQSDDKTQSDKFYVDFFVNDPNWSTPYPNAHEAPRWIKIERLLQRAIATTSSHASTAPLRILDVGCGRGWLTNLCSRYGEAQGVEPVAGVVDYARKNFPHLTFTTGTPKTILSASNFKPFDVVVCSEVIEHVPSPEQGGFARDLLSLLKPGGFLICTTPRGDALQAWMELCGTPNQPIEDWLTEAQLRDVFSGQGFAPLANERLHIRGTGTDYLVDPTPAELGSPQVLPLYQIWLFQAPQPVAFAPQRPPRVLYLPLEWSTWDRARHGVYPSFLGYEEGFAAAGVELTTIPIAYPLTSAEISTPGDVGVLAYIKSLVGADSFDQVWVELVHSHWTEPALEWLKTVAPVRLGIVIESLRYPPSVVATNAILAQREALVRRRLSFMTHAIFLDDSDAAQFASEASTFQSVWWAATVPARCVVHHPGSPNINQAAFLGSVYGERANWFALPELQGKIALQPSPEAESDLPEKYDQLHQQFSDAVHNGQLAAVLPAYLNQLRFLRRGIYDLSLDKMSHYAAVLDLVSLARGYFSSRVFDGMAVGRPVLHQVAGESGRHTTLFQDGVEFLTFRTAAELSQKLDRVLRDPKFAREMATRASDTVRREHTTEVRIGQLLKWVATGNPPAYYDKHVPGAPAFPNHSELPQETPRALPTQIVTTNGTFSKQQCENLLEQALTAIERGTPQVGLSLLADAILLAPNNRKYRDLYASLARKLGVGERV